MTAPRVPGAQLRHGRLARSEFFHPGCGLRSPGDPYTGDPGPVRDLGRAVAGVPGGRAGPGGGRERAHRAAGEAGPAQPWCCGGRSPWCCLALLGVGAGGTSCAQLAVALAVFGLAVGALDASMNMLGVSLQRAYGRSIMLGFHAAYSLGGIVGASLAWAGAHWQLSLAVSYGPVVAGAGAARAGRGPVVRGPGVRARPGADRRPGDGPAAGRGLPSCCCRCAW